MDNMYGQVAECWSVARQRYKDISGPIAQLVQRTALVINN